MSGISSLYNAHLDVVASADRSRLPPEREQLPPLEVPVPACMEQAELRLKVYAMSAR